MIAGLRRPYFRRRSGIPLFAPDMVGEGLSDPSDGRKPKNVRLGNVDQTRDKPRCAMSKSQTKSQTRNAFMKANAVRFSAGLALVAFGAPLPASGQYFPPALIIVPPPAHNYATPKPVRQSPAGRQSEAAIQRARADEAGGALSRPDIRAGLGKAKGDESVSSAAQWWMQSAP